MRYLKITNKGLLDIRLISLMGGTTKAGDKFKIGKFGTGMKYTLAYLFRNNIDFKVFVDGKEIKLHTEKENIQNTDFEIIHIDGQRSSITTQMGADWQAWMIIREMWCNAMDEGGHSKTTTELPEGAEGETSFCIQLTTEINDVLTNWDQYFVHDQTPMFETNEFAIYAGGKDMCIYKHGVMIHKIKDANSLFHYDIKNADINELRQYTGYLHFDLYKCISKADKKIAEYILQNMTEAHWEGKEMDYSYAWSDFSESWKEAIGSARLIHQKAVDTIRARELDIDLEATILVPQKLFNVLTRNFDGIGALRVVDKVNEFYEVHDEKLKQKLKEAITILESCDYLISPELKFLFGIFGDKNKFASVNLDTKEVLISEQMRDKSMFEFCTMLVEENGHFTTGYDDCSRKFQQYWINLYVKTMMEKHAVVL